MSVPFINASSSPAANHLITTDGYYTALINEAAGVTWDPSLSVRSVACFAEDLVIELDMQCSAVRTTNGRLASLRIISLKLEFGRQYDNHKALTDHEVKLLASVLRGFHSKLPQFPHLRVAELRSPLSLLQEVVKVAPDVSQLPDLGAERLYRWGCPRKDFYSAHSSKLKYRFIGVDPPTLEQTGMWTIRSPFL